MIHFIIRSNKQENFVLEYFKDNYLLLVDIYYKTNSIMKLKISQHQAQLILQNIPPNKSITGRGDHLARIISPQPIVKPKSKSNENL